LGELGAFVEIARMRREHLAVDVGPADIEADLILPLGSA
jgi:hypothetical protein